MDYDVTAIQGIAGKPAVLFIHGLGMDKSIWECPAESRILGGRLPLSLILSEEPQLQVAEDADGLRDVTKRLSFGEPPQKLTTLFHSLRDLGHTVITWSQRRPSAEIGIAVKEMRAVLSMHEKYCGSGIILIGHSRGGLVCREYLKGGDERVRALITLATPHKGSSMARWAKYLTPLVSLLNPLLSNSEQGTLKFAMKRIFDFLQSAAVKEVLPDSRFFRDLDDGRLGGVHYMSFGGSSPTLFSLYRRVIERALHGGGEKFVLRAHRVFSVPDILETIIPEGLYPEEMKRGRGDGLVSVQSSRIPWADEHSVFDVNHAGILFDERVRDRVAQIVRGLA